MGDHDRFLGWPKAACRSALLSLLPLVLVHCKDETASAPPSPLPQVEVVRNHTERCPDLLGVGRHDRWVGQCPHSCPGQRISA